MQYTKNFWKKEFGGKGFAAVTSKMLLRKSLSYSRL